MLADRAALAGPAALAVWGELVVPVGLEVSAGLAESVVLAAWVESGALVVLAESVVRVAGTAFQRSRPVEETAATGSISRNIVAVLPIATELQQIVSVEPRAAIRLPIVGIARGNNLVARAVIWEVIVQEVVRA